MAYEAYEVEDVVSQSKLRLQTDIAPWSNISSGSGGLAEDTNVYFNLAIDQQADLKGRLSAMLTGVPSQNMSVELTDNTYVLGNITQKSLDDLPRSVFKLDNVPAYRLSIDCKVDLPVDLSIIYHIAEPFTTNILVDYPAPGGGMYKLISRYAGPISMVGYQALYTWVFTAFNMGTDTHFTDVFLGAMTPFDLSNYTGPSTSYGDVKYRKFNMSEHVPDRLTDQALFHGYRIEQSMFGLHCSIFREQGLLNYTRFATNSSVSQWNTSSFIASNPPSPKVNVPTFLGAYQGVKLNYQQPGTFNPGLAPAFLPRNVSDYPQINATVPQSTALISLDEYALRFLYASGEAQRIFYEVAASNTSASHNPPEFFVEVPSVATTQRYRITIVPILLLLGLLALILAGVITAALMVFTWKTTSTRSFRRVDEVRLLVDSALLLRTDKEDLERLARCKNDDVDDWAAANKVKYVKMDREDGEEIIVLKKA